MVTRSNNTIIIQCSCGCSVVLIKYDFNNVWFDIQNSAFYEVQMGIKDVIRNRLDMAKHFAKNEEAYMADIFLNNEEFEKFVYALVGLRADIKSGKYDDKDSEESPSFLPSHVFVEREMDSYIVSIRAKYTLKDVLTGKVHKYYEPMMTKKDFYKFVDNVVNFYNKTKNKNMEEKKS